MTDFDAWLVKKFPDRRFTVSSSPATEWMVKQRENGWHVVDLHSEMRKKVDAAKMAAIRQRMQLYQQEIHTETKPLRPGVPQGGTMESAAAGAKALEETIYKTAA